MIVKLQCSNPKSALFDAHTAVPTCMSMQVAEVNKYMQKIAEKVFKLGQVMIPKRT